MKEKFDIFTSNKTGITFQAFENFFNGKGNPIAIKHAVSSVESLTDEFDNTIALNEAVNSIIEMLLGGATVFIYSDCSYFACHSKLANPDTLLIKYDGTRLHFLITDKDVENTLLTTAKWDGKQQLIPLVDSMLKSADYYSINGLIKEVGYFGVLPGNYIVPENHYEHPDAWIFVDTRALENKFDKTQNVSNTNSVSQIQNSTGEENMSKVNAIVSANKTAAVNAAKIEAGRIAVKQAVKLVKPAVPMMARGYLETALGELVVANLFKFAVDNFAANNDKAQVVADAMLQGAMMGAIQSLNIEELVNQVLDKVDVSKFTSLVEKETE